MNTQPDTSSQPAQIPQRSHRGWPVILAVGVVAILLLGGAGFGVASTLEEKDSFCISCHTAPETHYFNRAYLALDNPTDPVPDLATAHYLLAKTKRNESFACIACHRGDSSLGHRVSTLVLGGRDAVIYVLGKEDPTIEKTKTKEGWLPNAACTNCHTDTLLTLKGLDNHFHTHLPEAAAALTKGGTLTVPDSLKDKRDDLLKVGLKTVNTSLLCTDCHQAHTTVPGGQASFFMKVDQRNESCVSCHLVAKEGPQDANSLK